MFSDNKKDKNMVEGNAGQNFIAQGTKITGNFNSESGFRIEGVIEGDIKTPGKVVVGKTGRGNVHAKKTKSGQKN